MSILLGSEADIPPSKRSCSAKAVKHMLGGIVSGDDVKNRCGGYSDHDQARVKD